MTTNHPDPTPPPAEPTPSQRPVEDADLAELRRLYDHSTHGVWKLWAMELLADQDGTSNLDTAVPIANFFTRDEKGSPRTWDADFCRVAHNLTPALLDRLRAAEETLAVVGALAEEWRAYVPAARYPEASAYADATERCGEVLADLLDEHAALAEGASR